MGKNYYKKGIREAHEHGIDLAQLVTIVDHTRTGTDFYTAIQAQISLNSIKPSITEPRKVSIS